MAKNNGIWILAVLAVVVIGYLLISPTGTKEKDFMEVQFYDSDGNKIMDTSTFATIGVNGQEYTNIKYVQFKMNVENTGDTPLTISFLTVTPNQFSSAMDKSSFTLSTKGQKMSRESTLIDVTPFLPSSSEIQKTQTFGVTLRGTYVSQGTTYNIDKSTSIEIVFKNDSATVVDSGDMMFGANVWGWIPPEETAQLQNVGTNYDYLTTCYGENAEYYNTVQVLDSYNPDNVHLMYKIIACNFDSSAYYHGSCDSDIPTLHPDWMLHKAAGNWRVSDTTYVCDPYEDGSDWENKVCYMDLTNPAVRAYMIDVYIRALQAHPVYDGIILDIAPSDLDYYSGPTDKIGTDAAAFDSYKTFLNEAKTALNARGYVIMPEFSEVSSEGNNWNLLIPYVDGAYEEFFYYDWDQNKKTQAEIDKQIADCRETVRLGNVYLANVWLGYDEPQANWQSKITEAYDYIKTNCGTTNVVLFAGKYRLNVNNNNINIFNTLN